ncbi:hypothetical protein NBRC111894_2967 [Sporolactobacillus inulinus]|uniref:Uncharacterized protein n=1 Tax=Sporolactobacillus inulinus TaxID=2078 RepID=A0A4Y1ZEK5_9BACL|nr:hypothetical protein NBRC111894_2967 [Sporolactobacillus inulinus]
MSDSKQRHTAYILITPLKGTFALILAKRSFFMHENLLICAI